MTSQGAIWAIMKVSRMPLRPLKRIRVRAKAPQSAMTSDRPTASTVTRTEFPASVQKCGAFTAVTKCSAVPWKGNHTGSSVMMSRVGLKAVLNIQ